MKTHEMTESELRRVELSTSFYARIPRTSIPVQRLQRNALCLNLSAGLQLRSKHKREGKCRCKANNKRTNKQQNWELVERKRKIVQAQGMESIVHFSRAWLTLVLALIHLLRANNQSRHKPNLYTATSSVYKISYVSSWEQGRTEQTI